MKLQEKLLIIQLIVTTCQTEILTISISNESSSLIQALVEVMKSCYKIRSNTVGIVGDTSDNLLESLWSFQSLILLNETERSVSVSGPFVHKLQMFVVAVTASRNLEADLGRINNTQWWNHMANFYIIDWPPTELGCSRAFEALSVAWRMSIIEAKFVCNDRADGVLIYSFNPFISDAPDHWKLVEIRSGVNGHPWTLLIRKYSEDICDNYNFEKTKNLGGYELRLSVHDGMWHTFIDVNQTGLDSLTGVTGQIVRSMLGSMNATAKLLIHKNEEAAGYVDNEGKAHGVLGETSAGISDMSLVEWDVMGVRQLAWTYPHFYTGFYAMTQYSGSQSQLAKVISAIDKRSRLGVCVVCIVTAIFFIVFMRQSPLIAILNTLRLFCNSCLTKLPADKASRIYMTSLFILVVTVQGIYQGQLAALLSKRVPRPDIQKIQDFAKSDHVIYGYQRYGTYFRGSEFQGRFVGLEDYNCTEYVLQSPAAACILAWNELVPEAARLKFHLSKSSIAEVFATWVIRSDWPLEKKINRVKQRLVSGNIFGYTYTRLLRKDLHMIDHDANKGTDVNFRMLKINDVLFAFVILGIGLGFSTIVFIIELLIQRYLPLIIARTRRFYYQR